MKTKAFYEKTLKLVVDEMDLVDVKVYPDADGEVQAVLLKYIAPGSGWSPKDPLGEGRVWP